MLPCSSINRNALRLLPRQKNVIGDFTPPASESVNTRVALEFVQCRLLRGEFLKDGFFRARCRFFASAMALLHSGQRLREES